MLACVRFVDGDGDQFPADEELWSLEEAIPSDSAAAIALVEHRWAIGTRDAIRAAGGVPIADAWIHSAEPRRRRPHRR